MGRSQLVAMLGGSDAGVLCQQALENGATFTVHHGAMPATHYAVIYARRERLCRQRGISSVGFRQAVEDLQLAGDQAVCLGWVDTVDPPYHFQLFLNEDLSAIVACLGVDTSRGDRHQTR